MTQKDVIVYLDFNNRLPKEVFENGKEAFIRIANLNKNNPLAQVNDTVFQGTYDYALGTNLFFEPATNVHPQTDPFIKRGPVQYENTFKCVKTITFQPVRVPPKKVEPSQDFSQIEFYLDWDYPTLLQKISEGSIKLQDILKKDSSNEQSVNRELVEVERMEDEDALEQNSIEVESVEQQEKNIDNFTKNEIILDNLASKQILDDYQKLRELAFRPVKRKPLLDDIENCESAYKEAYEYSNLEKQVLQPCGLFASEPVDDINEETLSNCVDIDRCILYGIIEKSPIEPRILTKEEKQKVLTLDNFDNLSLSGRYYVLKTHVKNLDDYLTGKNTQKTCTYDKYGRTPLQTLEIYKKLMEAVKKRIEEIKFSLEENVLN